MASIRISLSTFWSYFPLRVAELQVFIDRLNEYDAICSLFSDVDVQFEDY